MVLLTEPCGDPVINVKVLLKQEYANPHFPKVLSQRIYQYYIVSIIIL